MPVLGIESSAHTFGVGVSSKGRILSNEKMMYPIGSTGMIPAEVAEFHVDNAADVVANAMANALIDADDIEGVGYTRRPGSARALRWGCLQRRPSQSACAFPSFR